MTEYGFLENNEKRISVRDILKAKSKRVKDLIFITPDAKLEDAIALMKKYSISQLPIITDGVQIGSIREITIMKNLTDDTTRSRKISEIMEPPLPSIKIGEKILSPLYLLKDKNGIIVVEDNRLVDIISTIDVVNYLIKR